MAVLRLVTEMTSDMRSFSRRRCAPRILVVMIVMVFLSFLSFVLGVGCPSLAQTKIAVDRPRNSMQMAGSFSLLAPTLAASMFQAVRETTTIVG